LAFVRRRGPPSCSTAPPPHADQDQGNQLPAPRASKVDPSVALRDL
jgi:hypothetical protein